MKRYRLIVLFVATLAFSACGPRQETLPVEVVQQAQNEYESGFVCLQNDCLMEALPHFFEVANCLERLPEDMTDEEMLLVSRAYYQMAHVFRVKMENNTEIDALRRALGYQEKVGDTTWLLRSSLLLAQAFRVVKEDDSARYYLGRVSPLLDTVSGDPWDYISAQSLLTTLCYDNHQYDSSFLLQRQLIAFKARRGMDTKNDSIALGMDLFFADLHAEAKPYLLKVLQADFGDVEQGAIMSLLGQIYEEEHQPDSAALFHKFNPTYVQAESERVSDGLLAVKQYEQFKAGRDARLQAQREQKERQVARRKKLTGIGIAVLLALALSAFFVYHRRYRKKAAERHEVISRDLQEARGTLEAKEQEALRLKAEAIYHDRHNNTGKRLKELFNEAYPDALPRLKAAHPDLNDTELDLCVLSFFGFRLKEMADILDLRENTVAKYRSHIKKKTQTKSVKGLFEPFLA